uniref:Uncharacterized protein n=1 Tax=Ditylenchus dipsaci TaxID=166011 RepID=A0A915EGX9_9BILA
MKKEEKSQRVGNGVRTTLCKQLLKIVVDWQPSEQSENSGSTEGSVLDRLLGEIDEEEKQKRQVETGTYSGAESWISEILKQGIAVQAASKTPVDALKYCTNLLLSVGLH